MVHCAAYDCLVIVDIPFYKFQADNQRRKQAVMTNDLRASSSKTTDSKPHRSKLRSDAVSTISFFALTKIKVRLRRNSKVGLQGYLSLHRG